jgi:hypothetical protein
MIAVRATKGKILRAEPVAALYEQCVAQGEMVDTERGKVPIECVTTSDRVMTRGGWRQVLWHGQTGVREVLEISTDSGVLRCTADHRVFTLNRGWVHAGQLVPRTDILAAWQNETLSNTNASNVEPRSGSLDGDADRAEPSNDGRHLASLSENTKSLMASDISSRATDIIGRADIAGISCFTEPNGKQPTDQFPMAGTFITSTKTLETIGSKTYSRSNPLCTPSCIHDLLTPEMSERRSLPASENGGGNVSRPNMFVSNAVEHFQPPQQESDFAPQPVIRPIGITSVGIGETLPVYDLTVETDHEFFASGVLVHNCRVHHVETLPQLEDQMCSYLPEEQAQRRKADTGEGQVSPDRLDAAVYAISELMVGKKTGYTVRPT